MATVSTNVKIDQTLKQEAQELFESFGLSLSSAINIFLRQSVREQAIPFRVGNPLPNMETIQAIEDARKGIGLSRGFTSVAELMEDLDADDQISDHILKRLQTDQETRRQGNASKDAMGRIAVYRPLSCHAIF